MCLWNLVHPVDILLHHAIKLGTVIVKHSFRYWLMAMNSVSIWRRKSRICWSSTGRKWTKSTDDDRCVGSVGGEEQVRVSKPATYVDKLIDITRFQVPKHRGIVKVGQVGHVLAFLVFGRVHLLQLVFLKGLLLSLFRIRFPQQQTTGLITARGDPGIKILMCKDRITFVLLGGRENEHRWREKGRKERERKKKMISRIRYGWHLRKSIWRSNAALDCATRPRRSGKSNRPCLQLSRISAD